MRPEAVKDFLTRASGSEIIDALTALANSDNLQALDGLRAFLLVRDDHTYMKHAVPRLASLAALQHGEAGVRLLVEALPMAPGMIYPTAILESLWHASKGQVPPTHFFDVLPPPPALTKPLPGDTIAAAAKGVRDVLADAALNEDLFQVVINFLWGTGFLAPDSFVDRKALLGLLAEGSIRLSPALIREYHDLIASDVREEEYQRFLMSHPVFID